MNSRPVFALLLLLPTSLLAEGEPKTAEQILHSVTLPPGYEATVFAQPPQVAYPTALSAAIDGTLFVAIDENGSLDRKEKRGRVLRLRDTKGTGVADEVKVFAEMDSPRGVIWDGAKGNGPGVLYVMHPPTLTAYYDDSGEGKANRQEDLLTGLGFDLSFRGADHTTNGCRMGIDGFIYIAMGDYGCVEAKGKDGTILRHRGGGIVRIRPDGTGLELVVEGTRNIYDVAVSPTMDLFTRDNTNDGGAWNDRLSFNPPGAHMGYPTLFMNFPEDHLQPLADYGDGAPCGSLWMDEAAFPKGLYTAEWGRNAIYLHTLQPKGGGWELVPTLDEKGKSNQGQQPWIKMTRPTDLDVDAQGAVYISSWDGATFTYNGPNAGYILRVTKKNPPRVDPVDLATTTPKDLLPLIMSESGALRLAAQREFLRRIPKGDSAASLPGFVKEKMVDPKDLFPFLISMAVQPLEEQDRGRNYAAAFAFTQASRLAGIKGAGFTREAFKGWPGWFRLEMARAFGDGTVTLAPKEAEAFVDALRDEDPRLRVAALAALRRLQMKDAAPFVLPLVADADPTVAHLARRALRDLGGAQVCLGALDSADEKVKPGALQALYGMYEPAVVEGLLSRLPAAQGEVRRGILNALCRLLLQDAPYASPQEWWGTRPDTSGPVYKPVKWSESDKIEAALKQEVNAAQGEDGRWLVRRMVLTKVNFPGLIELMLAKAGNDTPAKLTAIEGLLSPDNGLPADALAAAQGVAVNEQENPEFRARALRLLQRATRVGNNLPAVRAAAFQALVAAYAPLVGHDLGQPALTTAVEEFTHGSPTQDVLNGFEKLALSKEPAPRTLAQTVILNAATSPVVKGREKETATKALEKIWKDPAGAASLLGVIARAKNQAMAEQVRARLKDPNNAVAEAALFAYQSLGLSETSSPAQLLGAMKYEDAVAAVATGGDVAHGKEMFLRAGCIACHTVSEAEPPKGPILSAVVKIYDRAKLTESILKPNASIAQGFETQWFKTKKGDLIEGFVTREGGDSVDVRNIAAQTVTLEKSDIAERGKRDVSMMPEGLMNAFAPADLASLLTYLESLRGTK